MRRRCTGTAFGRADFDPGCVDVFAQPRPDPAMRPCSINSSALSRPGWQELQFVVALTTFAIGFER
jgi:hypothetical protein